MSDSLVDLLFLAFSCTALFAVAGVGILALPWKDEELVDTTRAVRHAWRKLDDALRLAGASEPSAQPRRRPVHSGYRGESPSVAFDRPSVSA